MARKLNSSLIEKLKTGVFSEILKYINQDSDLTLEIRTSSEALIYYRKSKVLTLSPNNKEPKILSDGYWKKKDKPILILDNPKSYFDYAKELVNNYSVVKNNLEFIIQQKILKHNNSLKNKYFVVDMEYQFAQNIIIERTNKKTRFDLIAINHIDNKIILFELKQGFDSTPGNSGVYDHLDKYIEHLNHKDFRNALISDIRNIVSQKEELGIFQFETKSLLAELEDANIEFKIIFAYKNIEEVINFYNQFGKNISTLYIDINDLNYTLKDKMTYKEIQKKIQINKLKDFPSIFRYDKGMGNYGKYQNLKFVLQDGKNNLYEDINDSVCFYFEENNIAWWGDDENYPTGHLVSSQIQCLNYLYALRKDKDAILKLAQIFDTEFDDILPTIIDKDAGYISFEFIYDNAKLLNENDRGVKRGAFCTSIDAFIIAKKKDKKILIPIEWKYSEIYLEEINKAKENVKGVTRKKRYNHLIENSMQLNSNFVLEESVYYYEPFYELMRQTLLVEKMVESGLADDFVHIMIAPIENKELLDNIYTFSKGNLETTWHKHITNEQKFKIIDHKHIFQLIDKMTDYSNLAQYLKIRY